MGKPASRLLSGARVGELTQLHGVTLGKLVKEGFLRRDENRRYTGVELICARALAALGTRASKAEADRDRRAVETIRRALEDGKITATTDLVVAQDQDFMTLTHTQGQRLDATFHLRDYMVLGVGAWLTEYQQREPQAFEVNALIAAA
ncbi:hypothetical protein SMD44_p10094 (plasmid) [Streptomyces alboflavus]|uniref:MerR family transcriptional regulator n=1 Tax=Streptomyces alboflavus TaxID=67267 RepID=A0A291W3W4_9ACTN|nr:hypothetical protein [Streptomyces alboflavus]ATM24593.1 hypothetical protein SMD44_p10094 [Streptomyces alboflavus]